MELDNLLHPDADSNIETVIVLQVLLSSTTPVCPATSLPLSAYVVYFSLGLPLPNIPLSANASTLIRHTRRHISNPPHIWHQHTSAPAHRTRTWTCPLQTRSAPAFRHAHVFHRACIHSDKLDALNTNLEQGEPNCGNTALLACFLRNHFYVERDSATLQRDYAFVDAPPSAAEGAAEGTAHADSCVCSRARTRAFRALHPKPSPQSYIPIPNPRTHVHTHTHTHGYLIADTCWHCLCLCVHPVNVCACLFDLCVCLPPDEEVPALQRETSSSVHCVQSSLTSAGSPALDL